MSDTLFGKEGSGTPLETRGLAGQTGREFSSLLGGGAGGASQRISDMFGIDFNELGLQDFATSIFSGEAPGLAGFDAANRPFQQRALSDQAGQTASAFGTSGGRFSRNLLGAQAAGSAQLQQGFDQNRFDFSQARRGQDIQALLGSLSAIPGLQQASLAPLVAAGNFAQPGAPIFQEGIFGELLGAGATLFQDPLARLLGGGQSNNSKVTG